MRIKDLKPINTVFSVDSILNIEELNNAKRLMNEKYGNQFSHIPAHINFMIKPFPEYNLKKGIELLEKYVVDQQPIKVFFSDIEYEDKGKFFFLKVTGDDIIRHHENITEMFNELRENYVRQKDLDRLNRGEFDNKSEEYLIRYGYNRVFDNFRLHLTIGNITVDDYDIQNLFKQLREMLKGMINKEVEIDNIHGVFHTDSSNQSNMMEIWNKVYSLKKD